MNLDFKTLRTVKNQDLLSQTKSAVMEERKLTTQILHLLREVERRKLFAELGFSSLFLYCVKELGYSESQAQRRISSMRVLKEIPQIEEKIESGVLSLSNISQAQSFFRSEAKQERPLSVEQKTQVLASLENKSTREAEKELIKLSPQPLPKEKVRAITEDTTEYRFVANQELSKKIEKLKSLLSHKNPSMGVADLIDTMAEICLNKLDPERRQKPKQTKNLCRNAYSTSQVTRYIPSTLKQKVWMRDGGRCTYKDPQTGRPCHSNHLLQVDHQTPFAMGGPTTLNNLRLLCSTHNQLMAVKHFGQKPMEKYLKF